MCAHQTNNQYVSALSSAFAQHGAEFQVSSAPDSLRAIGNPKMYKPTQQFFSFPPGPATQAGSSRDKSSTPPESFHLTAAITRSSLPIMTFLGHLISHFFHLFQMIPSQADHGDTGPRIASEFRKTRRKRQFGDIFFELPHLDRLNLDLYPMNRLSENMSWWNTIDSIPLRVTHLGCGSPRSHIMSSL